MSVAFTQIAALSSNERVEYFGRIALSFFMLMLPIFTFLIMIKQSNLRVWLFWIALMLPINVVNAISGFFYIPDTYYSLTWPARFSLIYALSLAVIGLSFAFKNTTTVSKHSGFSLVGFVIVILSMQVVLLRTCRDYAVDYFGLRILFEAPVYDKSPSLRGPKELSKILPKNYPIALPDRLFAYFHRYDVVWTSRTNIAYQNPRMFVFDATNQFDIPKIEILSSLKYLESDGISYYFVEEDQKYLEMAGILAYPDNPH